MLSGAFLCKTVLVRLRVHTAIQTVARHAQVPGLLTTLLLVNAGPLLFGSHHCHFG